MSERAWQKSDRTFWRAKNTDTFKPMGPWITTGLDEKALEAMETTVRLNGETRTRFRTWDMLFGVRRFIATMTRYLTLHPGDVVEIELSGIGTLRNPFVAAGAAS